MCKQEEDATIRSISIIQIVQKHQKERLLEVLSGFWRLKDKKYHEPI
jgi:hypothetical protein